MTTKCVCGYEKIGNTVDEDGRYSDADPQNLDFKEVKIVGSVYNE